MDTLAASASPEAIARAASEYKCRSVAFTYNDPVIFFEYAIDVADACKSAGIFSTAVTAGYICEEPRIDFFKRMDAANIDLKAFSEEFYWKLTGAHLKPVLETLVYLKKNTNVWIELTTLLIPGENDSDQEIDEMTTWVVDNLGPDVPMHFTAFHPDYKMTEKSPTPAATLSRARSIAVQNGVRYAYTGNTFDLEGQSTYCHSCGTRLIGRNWYNLSEWNLTSKGLCKECGTRCSGFFESIPGDWGSRRMPIRIT